MSAVAEFLKKAFPEIGGELAERAADELVGKSAVSAEEHKEALELAESYKKEIGKLHEAIARQRDGYTNASIAGLDVLGERARQRRLEGYDDAHDDSHDDFSLSQAAMAYASDAILRGTTGRGYDEPPSHWPWSSDDWKPKQIRKSLVVAAALLVAEIERLDRSGAA